ncbi:MAG: hypothetical protein V2I32_00315, partial [Desulforhopalus sp.]|nr:hypothetical protein [Desulforhopalus sp.]
MHSFVLLQSSFVEAQSLLLVPLPVSLQPPVAGLPPVALAAVLTTPVAVMAVVVAAALVPSVLQLPVVP